MNPVTWPTASKVRELMSRGLKPKAYLPELSKLADIEDMSNRSDLAIVDRVFALRARIEMLEDRVRNLEAPK